MHFLREALYRKPLEPRYLVYYRGGTAITLGCLFLAFCSFLIVQIHNDTPLIVYSSQDIESYVDTPDIEVCSSNSTIHIAKCTGVYYNWTTIDIEDCWTRFFRAGLNTSPTKCYVFESNGTYNMAAGVIYDSRDALRRLDFYWKIDSLLNASFASISIPTLALQLYDPSFSSWKRYTLGDSAIEQKIMNNIQLGDNRASTMLNYSTGISYYPLKYRSIKPKDAAAIIGIKPNYIDITTLPNTQKDWPLQETLPSSSFDRSLYDGVFSVALEKSTIDVQAEVRQHTLLQSFALVGGCYGILTTIYILLFGMTRLTPWGLVHQIPVYLSKHRQASIEHGAATTQKDTDNDRITTLTPRPFQRPLGIQETFTSQGMVDTTNDLKTKEADTDYSSASERHLLSSPTSYYQPPEQYPDPDISPDFKRSSSYSNQDLYAILNIERERSDLLQERSTELMARVKELETILSEFFIDTAYIESLRDSKNPFFAEEGHDKPKNPRDFEK